MRLSAAICRRRNKSGFLKDGGAAQEAKVRAAKDGSRKPAGRMGMGREWAAFIGAILYEPAPPPEAWAAGGRGGAGRRGEGIKVSASSRRGSTGPHDGL